MGKKICLVILIMILLGSLPLLTNVSAEDNINVIINMMDEQPQTRFDSPIIVAGIWHYINITIKEQDYQIINLKFYKGSSIPPVSQRNETNYYEYNYNDNNLEWADLKQYDGYTYINKERCEKKPDYIIFCIGVKDTLSNIVNFENWTLEIYKDITKIYSDNILLEKPIVGLAKTHADTINYNINPFSETDLKGYDYFIIENVGNVPLITYKNYQVYNNSIEALVSHTKISPKSTINYELMLHAGSWKPGILRLSGSVIGYIPSYLIITTSVVTFENSFEINAANLKINIGHSNYSIQEIPDSTIVFQYEKTLEMNEGQTKDIIVYVSGEGNVSLDIQADKTNVEIIKITSKDQNGSPLTIHSKDTSEYLVTISVKAIRESKVGVITYKLKTNNKVTTYTTNITIGPPIESETKELNIPITTIFVAFCIIIVIIYIIIAQIRNRRRKK